jgi:hypothetical protein
MATDAKEFPYRLHYSGSILRLNEEAALVDGLFVALHGLLRGAPTPRHQGQPRPHDPDGY